MEIVLGKQTSMTLHFRDLFALFYRLTNCMEKSLYENQLKYTHAGAILKKKCLNTYLSTEEKHYALYVAALFELTLYTDANMMSGCNRSEACVIIWVILVSSSD